MTVNRPVGALEHLRADLHVPVDAGRFSVQLDDATVDTIVGALLLAIRRTVDGSTDVGYPARVVTQLLRSLGHGESTSLAERVVDDADLLTMEV